MKFSDLFRVSYVDFYVLWAVNDPLDWVPPFEVREVGIFIPTPKRLHRGLMTPEQLASITHPTGNPNEPVLAFPCSLGDMLAWGRDYELDCQSSVLVDWMHHRVERNRCLTAGASLNIIAERLFEVNQKEAETIIPGFKSRAMHRSHPSTINTLLKWRSDALKVWTDGKRRRRPQVGSPSNEAIVRLIEGRLAEYVFPKKEEIKPLKTRERNNLRKVILGLGQQPPRSNQPNWEALSREAFYPLIATAFKEGNFALVEGSKLAVAKQMLVAEEKGWIEHPLPQEKLIGDIIKAARNFLPSPKR
jgi:hypothetical protein